VVIVRYMPFSCPWVMMGAFFVVCCVFVFFRGSSVCGVAYIPGVVGCWVVVLLCCF